jgi:hypothetical protein
MLDGGRSSADVLGGKMTDKEVGELWQSALRYSAVYPYVQALIRKLVEERDELLQVTGPRGDGSSKLEEALAQFGIDATTWKETT